jgi:hypothetical protein
MRVITLESLAYQSGYNAYAQRMFSCCPGFPDGQVLREDQTSDILEFRRGWVEAEEDERNSGMFGLHRIV